MYTADPVLGDKTSLLPVKSEIEPNDSVGYFLLMCSKFYDQKLIAPINHPK